jgi:hypothetical protein
MATGGQRQHLLAAAARRAHPTLVEAVEQVEGRDVVGGVVDSDVKVPRVVVVVQAALRYPSVSHPCPKYPTSTFQAVSEEMSADAGTG